MLAWPVESRTAAMAWSEEVDIFFHWYTTFWCGCGIGLYSCNYESTILSVPYPRLMIPSLQERLGFTVSFFTDSLRRIPCTRGSCNSPVDVLNPLLIQSAVQSRHVRCRIAPRSVDVIKVFYYAVKSTAGPLYV